jgi:hypothetical protein
MLAIVHSTEARSKTMTAAVRIDPDAVLDDGALLMEFGISAATLARARREGKLRYTRKGRRILYLGVWILNWLQMDPWPEGLGEVNDVAAGQS